MQISCCKDRVRNKRRSKTGNGASGNRVRECGGLLELHDLGRRRSLKAEAGVKLEIAPPQNP